MYSFYLFILLLPASTCFFFFFFNDTATTEIYTLSLHDALPIWRRAARRGCLQEDRGLYCSAHCQRLLRPYRLGKKVADRKSTRLNSSHQIISYAVFCLKKKKKLKIKYYH